MGRRLLSVVLVSFCLIASADFQKMKIEKVTALSSAEPFEPLLFLQDQLWVGRSRGDNGLDYRVQLFSKTNQVLSEVKLKHSVTKLYPYGANQVLALGVTPHPAHSRFTVIQKNGNKLKIVKELQFPLSIMALSFMGTPGQPMFFGAPGGELKPMLDEEATLDDEDPFEEAKTIFTLVGSQRKFLDARVHYPGDMVQMKGDLYVLEMNGPIPEDDNLVRVDLKTEKMFRVLDTYRNGLTGLMVWDENTIVMSETGANQVLIYDTKNRKLKETIQIEALAPTRLGRFGNCLAVGSKTKKLTWVKLGGEKSEVMAKWDLSAPEFPYYGIKNIAVDSLDASVYFRSAYPLTIMDGADPNRNGVFKTGGLSDALKKACQ